MPLLALVIVATLAGLVTALVARRLPTGVPVPAPAEGTDARAGPQLRRGLELIVSLVVIVAGGLVLAVLAYLVRSDTDGVGLDASAGDWGQAHATDFTTSVLEAITFFGDPSTVIVMAVALGIGETVRTRSGWVIPFLVAVVAGNGILTRTIKDLADRVRPELNPIADTLGPSFPSGHSSWAAAFFAAAALLLSSGRPRTTRIALAAGGVACAVAVAATRVLLGVHWLSDVLAGLALGWAWFAVCAILFGRSRG